MAKPGPSTDGHLGNKSGWEAVGYDGRHHSIEGFANFHEFQIGGVVLMPTVGKLVTVPGPPDKLDGEEKRTEVVHGYGYGQDEDQRQLGAWYVLAAIGLFDVQGGTTLHPTRQLAAPLFDRVRIQLNRHYYPGAAFEIQAAGERGQPYIQSARLNDRALDRCWIPWDDIVRGGRLELVLGKEPNKSWGILEPPPSGE